MIRIACLVVALGLLAGCDTLNLKLKGGSNSGIDWTVGLRF